MSKSTSNQRVRFAVVGLDHVSPAAVLAAFEQNAAAELCALATQHEAERDRFARRYDVGVSGGVDQLEQVLAQSRAQAIYLTTPSATHRSIAERAARAGVHVLCEPPLAPTAADCEAMIACCERAGVRLMVACRLHFDEAHLDAITIARGGQLGIPRLFVSTLTAPARDGGERAPHELHPGVAHELAVDPINTARHLFGAEPIRVFSASARGDGRLRDVDATLGAILVFEDDRIAQFSVSLAASGVASYRLIGDKGDLRVEPAYVCDVPLRQLLTIGHNSVERRFLQHDPLAALIRALSRAILDGGPVHPSGEEGLADVRVIEALLESARTGRAIDLPRRPHLGRTECG